MTYSTRIDVAAAAEAVSQLTLITLFFLVPMVVLPVTSELFEFNKIIAVYTGATILLSSEAVRILTSPKVVIRISPLYLTGALFLLALALATTFSIDQHVSLFGYYGRFHGGFLSWLSYGVIFFAISQRNREFYLALLKVSLFSSALVASWGFLEHWGIDASYWVQDVRARVFSTLGQPNWLAAFLAMMIPWSVYFYLTERRKQLLWIGLTSLLYVTFVFTYSRGGNIGLGAGVVVLLAMLASVGIKPFLRKLLLLALPLALITILFATPLTSRLFPGPAPRTVQTLEGGDETGNIRLIVWQGAWDIFRHYPLLGSGPETFGESFYRFRPVEMNKTSEWDFLFNKAHNEYLNYLATTGIAGTVAYLALLGSFIWLALARFLREKSANEKLLLIAAVSSTSTYLVQNIFGFTVVPLALLFIFNLAYPAFSTREIVLAWPRSWALIRRYLTPVLLIALMASLYLIANLWRADVAYSQGSSYNSLSAYSSAEIELLNAVRFNPTEPLYLAQLAVAEANLAVSYKTSDTGASLAKVSIAATDQAVVISPKELSLWRLRAQVFETLTELDQKYLASARAAREKAAELAPTEPNVQMELANFYLHNDQIDVAIEAFTKVISLKDNFLDPYLALTKIYLDQGDKESAKLYLDRARELDPTNAEVQELTSKL